MLHPKIKNLILIAFLFKSMDGSTWSVDLPAGWHVIDSDEGIAEGIDIRIASSPDARWDNPAPPANNAAIVIQFYPLLDNKPILRPFNNGYPDFDATLNAVKASLHRTTP